MATAQEGNTVKVHYTGKLDDGTEFDSSRNRKPLEFIIGKQMVIPGFEKAVIGLSPGESVAVNIPVNDAYGPRLDQLVLEVEKTQLPDDIKLEIGAVLEMKRPDGRIVPVRVAKITDEQVILDANHPLAGKNLNFEIELLEIVEQS